MTVPRPSWFAIAVASVAGGLLLSLAMADARLGGLAWCALVPWLHVTCRTSPGRAAAGGLLGGFVAACLTFGWLSSVPAFGAAQFVVLGGYVALYAALWCAGLAWLRRQGAPMLVVAPALWVALELLRHHAGFLALPIASLAQSQHAQPVVLQLASLGGEAVVSALVVLGNVAIAALLERRSRPVALASAAMVAAALVSGAWMLNSDDPGVALTLAAVQPDIGLHERETAAGREAIWQRLERLSVEAARARPDLIVWPETAVGDPRHDADLAQRLATLAGTLRTPLIVGASETEKFAVAAPEGTQVDEREAYNAAYLVHAGMPLAEPYRKRRLMPFGEYTPLADRIDWPRWLVPAVAVGRAGTGDADFRIAPPSSRDTTAPLRLGVVICWENLFADLSRDAVRGGAQALVQLTNDGWFGPGRAAVQHNAASVLRAVENGVPLVLASNAGPSLVIDARGRVAARTAAQFSAGVAVATVAVGRGATVYTRFGDWFAFGCVALLLCSAAAGRLRSAARGARTPLFIAKEHP